MKIDEPKIRKIILDAFENFLGSIDTENSIYESALLVDDANTETLRIFSKHFIAIRDELIQIIKDNNITRHCLIMKGKHKGKKAKIIKMHTTGKSDVSIGLEIFTLPTSHIRYIG